MRAYLWIRGWYTYRRCYKAVRSKSHGALDPGHTIAAWLASCERFIVYGQHYPGSRSWRQHARRVWQQNMDAQRRKWLAGIEKEQA